MATEQKAPHYQTNLLIQRGFDPTVAEGLSHRYNKARKWVKEGIEEVEGGVRVGIGGITAGLLGLTSLLSPFIPANPDKITILGQEFIGKPTEVINGGLEAVGVALVTYGLMKVVRGIGHKIWGEKEMNEVRIDASARTSVTTSPHGRTTTTIEQYPLEPLPKGQENN